jgi:hypothetical protein
LVFNVWYKGAKIAQNNSKCWWLYYLWNKSHWLVQQCLLYLPTMCKPTCRHPEIEKRKPCAAMMCNCQKKSVINWTWLLVTLSDWPIVMIGWGGLPCLHLVLQGHFLSEHQGREVDDYYLSTLANLTLIIYYFQNMLKFSKNYFFQIKYIYIYILWRKNSECLGIFHLLKWIFQKLINSLFNGYVLKWPRYYGI